MSRLTSASGMQRSKVTEVESSIIEKEAMELKHKDFVIAMYLMGMHSVLHHIYVCTKFWLSP